MNGNVTPLEILLSSEASDQRWQNAAIPAANGEPTALKVESGDSGTEAIVIITSDATLEVEDMKTVFPKLVDQSDTVYMIAAFYRNGSRDFRGSEDHGTTKIAGAARNQKRIWEVFREHGCNVYSVVYGFRDRAAGPR